MIKKKRVTKLLSILSVSLGIVIATLFSNTQDIKAYSYTSTTYSIQTSFSTEAIIQDGISNDLTGCAIINISINFNDYYSGSFTLRFKNPCSVSYSVVSYNASFNSKSNTQLNVTYNATKNILLQIYIDINEWRNKAVNTYNVVLSDTDFLNDYLGGSNGNGWKTYFDINNFTNNSQTIDTPIDEIKNDVATIETDLDTISSQLTTINNTLLNMNGVGSSGGPSFSWHSYQTQYVAMLAKMGVTWDSSVLNSLFVANGLSSFNQNLGTNQFYILPNSTLHIIHISNSGGAYYVKQNATTYTDLLDNITSDVVNAYGGSGIVLNHITITNNTNNVITGYFWRANASQWIYPIFWGYVVPDEVLELLGKDTTTNKLLTDILEAMSNININVENNQEISNVVNNKNSIITNITNQHNTVNNITNDFAVDFDTANNAITFDTDIITGLTNTATFWNGKLQEVELAMGDFQYPVVFGFILLAVLALIGV